MFYAVSLIFYFAVAFLLGKKGWKKILYVFTFVPIIEIMIVQYDISNETYPDASMIEAAYVM